MAYFELLARDYSEWLSQSAHEFTDFHPSGQGGHAADAAIVTLLQSALAEIEQSAIFSAVSASLTGAMLDAADPDIPLQHLATYAPHSDEAYPALKRRMIETGVGSHVVVALETHHARLNFALRLTSALLTLSRDISAVQRRQELEKLDDAWKRACGAALQASEVVRQVLARSGNPASDEPFAGRAAIVRSARDGRHPCVDHAGQVTVPGWAEKRKAARYAVGQRAKAVIEGEQKDVTITDASRTGLGLKGLPDIAIKGSLISIVLQSGERLSGTVAWARAGASGVMLDEPLANGHVLLKRGRS